MDSRHGWKLNHKYYHQQEQSLIKKTNYIHACIYSFYGWYLEVRFFPLLGEDDDEWVRSLVKKSPTPKKKIKQKKSPSKTSVGLFDDLGEGGIFDDDKAVAIVSLSPKKVLLYLLTHVVCTYMYNAVTCACTNVCIMLLKSDINVSLNKVVYYAKSFMVLTKLMWLLYIISWELPMN